jgi:Cdc6-like AAA superfamily ATPase
MDKTAQFKMIDQAFLPAREIEIPDLFSGRREEIIQGLYALRSQGASICIYGKRGVGKSSIAKQLRLVASGYPALTDLIKRSDLFDPDLFNFPSVYFYCDDTIKDADDLFRKILADRDSLNGICQYNDGIILKKTKTKTTQTAKLACRLLEASEIGEQETENIVAGLDSVSAFKSVTAEIVDSANTDSIVVVIDEFERVSSKIGIASIIKTCPHVKFILVGISEDLRSLIIDHESVGRHFSEGTIKINPMTDEMLIEILKRAETIIKEIKFEEQVIARIIELANGYPHWVHLMGKLSCIDVVECNGKTVQMENFQRALEKIVKSEIIHEDNYMRATSGLKDKEKMLKILASDKEDKLNPEEKYKVAEEYGISYAGWQYYIQNLIKSDILQQIQYHFTSFKDIRFKVYCKLRPPLYPENSIENLTDEKKYTGITYAVWDFKLDENVRSYLYSRSPYDSYYAASKFVPITTQYTSYMGASLEPETILYDSKGNPIKSTESSIDYIAGPRRKKRVTLKTLKKH